MKKLTTALAAVVAVAAPLAVAAPAEAAPRTRSLAAVLASDGNHFDRNRNDFDITAEAVKAVLRANPDSPVAVLADGDTALTAFLPTDRAFKYLNEELTGRFLKDEKRTFNSLVDAVGVETIEDVLLYHVVPGATINRKAAFRSDGAELTTALGPTLEVNVVNRSTIRLIDADTNDDNAKIVRFDINRGNKQIAHGINAVLRPVDLP